jgi:hypothetical protein
LLLLRKPGPTLYRNNSLSRAKVKVAVLHGQLLSVKRNGLWMGI